MEFSLLEKQAITKVVLDLANVDGEVSSEEVKYLELLKEHFHISWEEMIKGSKLNYSKSLAILHEMDEAKKSAFALIMTDMIAADGVKDEAEMSVFMTVIRAVEIKLPDYNEED